MLHKASDVIGRTLQAKDGKIGDVRDYFFDDTNWTLRYLVVSTSPWMDYREVLIAPGCFRDVDWRSNDFPADLTREQVRNSPDIDARPPLAFEQELQLIQYWGWPSREFPDMMLTKPVLGAESDARTAVMEKAAPPSLHRWREAGGYPVAGPDGQIGTLKDLIVDDLCWAIRYLMVKTTGLLHAHQTLVPAERVERVDWGNSRIVLAAKRETVETSPEYDSSQPLDRAFEEKLCAHYGDIKRRE